MYDVNIWNDNIFYLFDNHISISIDLNAVMDFRKYDDKVGLSISMYFFAPNYLTILWNKKQTFEITSRKFDRFAFASFVCRTSTPNIYYVEAKSFDI